MRVHILVEADVNPTEDLEKVETAIMNIFPTASIAVTYGEEMQRLIATMEDLEGVAELRRRLQQERILAAARRVLQRGTQGQSIIFYLNKQVAYVERISFCEPAGESPLGPLEVTIQCDEPRDVIDWLTMDSPRDPVTR